MRVMGIDPGQKETAFIVVESDPFCVIDKGILPNKEFLETLDAVRVHAIAVEDIQNYGMPVGQPVFDTCKQIGRIEERVRGRDIFFYKRPTIKAHFCNTVAAKDPNVNLVLKDRCGGRNKGQPLEGVMNHTFAALAVALYHIDKKED